MTLLSKSANIRFTLDGNPIDGPRNLQDIEVLATFDNESTQANITTSEFIFVNKERDTIKQYVDDGLTGGFGIFEGLSLGMEAYNNDPANTRSIFDGFLDLTQDYQEDQDIPQVSCMLKRENGLNQFEERLKPLSYGFLESKGVFTASDYQILNYVVVKKINVFEELVAGIILFQMIKELQESIKNTVEAVANVVAIAASGLTGPIAATVLAIAYAAILIAYTVVLVIAIIDLGKQLINTLSPFLREHRVLKLDTAIRKVCTHLGYTLNTNITEMQDVFFLPSNPRLPPANFVDQIANSITVNAGTPTGLPNTQDTGYFCTDMFALVLNAFNAKISIIGNTLHLLPKDDPFWIQTATYTLPKVRPKTKRRNTDEFNATTFLAFDTDLSDSWTIDNFKGTNFQIIVDAINVGNAKAKYLKGLDEIRLNVCLGSRYDSLNRIEQFLNGIAGRIDNLVNALGGDSDLAGSFGVKIGALKQEKNWSSKPKLVKLQGRKLPSNYRTQFSAKVLYNKYHAEKSFVANGSQAFYGQKIKFLGVRVPFGLEDFVSLIDNSYFTTDDQQQAKVISIKWRPSQDFAVIDYWIRTPYTKNLEETFIEPPTTSGSI